MSVKSVGEFSKFLKFHMDEFNVCKVVRDNACLKGKIVRVKNANKKILNTMLKLYGCVYECLANGMLFDPMLKGRNDFICMLYKKCNEFINSNELHALKPLNPAKFAVLLRKLKYSKLMCERFILNNVNACNVNKEQFYTQVMVSTAPLAEELAAKVFHPMRLDRYASKYGMSMFELNEVY